MGGLFTTLAHALSDPQSADAEKLVDSDLGLVLDLAEYHLVAGQVAAAFVASGRAVPAACAELRTATAIQHLRHVQALQRIGDALDRASIRWVVLKGPVLSSVWYRDPAARVYYDLDILVDPQSLSRAIDALATEGFTEYNRNWAGFRSLGLGEVPLGDGTVTLDLHWHLLTFEKDRRVFAFPTSDVLDRRVEVSLGSVSAWSLAADDTVSHCAPRRAGRRPASGPSPRRAGGGIQRRLGCDADADERDRDGPTGRDHQPGRAPLRTAR